MTVLAVIGFCWIAIFIVALAAIAAAVSNAADDPLFAETPAEEFADDYTHVAREAGTLETAFGPLTIFHIRQRCARPHCTDPVFRDSLCADHFDVMVGMVDELRRDLEET